MCNMKQIIFLLLVSSWMTASTQSMFFDSTFVMENESGRTEIPVKVSSSTDVLAIAFDGRVSNGSIEIELRDPDGHREGGFQLNTSSNDYVTTRHSKHGGSDVQSTRSVIRSSGSSMSVETSTSSGKNGKSKSKSKSKSNSNSNSNSNSGSQSTSSSASGSTSDSGSGENSSTTVTTSSSSGETISVTSEDGEILTITKSGDGTSEEHSNHQNHHGSGEAKGTMIESISDPAPGIWKIILKTEDVTGRLKIAVEQN